MPLLEIIKHDQTSPQTLATAVHFGRQQGKIVIVVNDGTGFYVNRILAPYINAALALGIEGVPFEKIDQAMVNFGFPVGPFKLLDEVGIDIAHKIQVILEQSFGERMKSCGIQEILIAKKRLGKKVKKGFYHYRDARKKNTIDPSIYTDLAITPHAHVDEKDIIQRCLQPMLEEAQRCLEDNIIGCARDGDIGAVFGIGFPAYLGGPFQYMKDHNITIKQH
jgi:3-hydroxyacyl-CoA dehydrogenase/enoyl-CoA hydratase/3-hydroxybutyryl-CoA epimerase